MTVTIPDNDLNIPAGTYSINEFVTLLRENEGDAAKVRFLADMLEQ